MEKLKSMLSGKKTYLIGFGMIVFAALGLALGYMSEPEAGTLILEALGIMGLRAGMAKI